MSHNTETDNGFILTDFQEELGRSKYAFMHALLKLNADLNQRRQSVWRFAVSDLPVDAQGKEARIDFILRRPGAFILAKCVIKSRTRPNWCFAKAPYHIGSHSERGIVERLSLDENNQVNFHLRHTYADRAIFHIAMEVGSDGSEDAVHRQPRNIRRAMVELSRGVYGLSSLFNSNLQLFPPKNAFSERERAAAFIPVIFTTAGLWATDADLGSGQAGSGRIDLSQSSFTKERWVLFQHHTSAVETHPPALEAEPRTLEEFAETRCVQTVAVVGPSGLADFLRWAESFDSY